MKKRIIQISKIIIIVGFVIGVARPALAVETVANEAQKTATETVGSQVKVAEEPVPEAETQETVAETIETTETTEVKKDEEATVTKKETEKIVEDADALIKETVGEPKGEPIDLNKEHTASSIRETLLSAEYGISKAELDKYSDKQLEDAMTLFLRYNYDLSGMDPSSYVRLLTTLYVDKTISIDKALGQLSFNPASFKTFGDMIPQVEALQLYLATLYPVNSSFFSGKTFTNEELIAVLTHLNGFETEVAAQGGQLAGRIVYILNSKEYGQTVDSTTTSDTQDKTKTSETSQPAKVLNDKKDKKIGLPQTGEEKAKLTAIIAGVVIVIGAIVLLIVKRKNKQV